MIKMISFNNFDNFDGKTNASSDAKTEATAQNFTAILSGFTPLRTKPENMPPSGEMFMKKNMSGEQADKNESAAQESDIEAIKNFMFPPQNFKAEKTTSGDQTEVGTLVETSSPREETSIHKNKMMPEQLAHLYQVEDPTNKQNGEIINGKIQVNYLYQPDTTKEIAADAPERLPVVQTNNEKIAPPVNQETFAENAPERGILTQFDNIESKQPSMWSREQSIPREIPNEIPNVRIPNFANRERRESSVRFVTKQDDILDLPANDLPLPQKTKEDDFDQMSDLYQLEFPETKQNGEIKKGEIPVNHLDQSNTGKEIVAEAPERLPILTDDLKKIEPQTNRETFAEYPPEGRILTQFDNIESKQPSMWSREQSIPREIPNEIPNVGIPNFANRERRESSVRFVTKQDGILDLPANNFPPVNAEIKETPILTIANGKAETVEILSVESSSAKPVNNNFLAENKPISVEKVLTEENKAPVQPKIEISEIVSEIKNSSKNLNSAEKVLSDLNPFNVASYENNQVKPTAGQTDILEFPEIQTSDTEEIVEIKTDNFELLDFTQGETSEITQIPSEQDFAANEFEIKTLDEKTQAQLNQRVKTEIPPTGETKINADPVQFKNLKYFFNNETNRVDEVHISDLPADSVAFSETETANLKKDSAVESQLMNGLTKLYDKVSEIVREDGASDNIRAEIKGAEVKTEIKTSEIKAEVETSEVKAKNPVANQSEELWAGYTNDNPVHPTNPMRRESKSREISDNPVDTTNSIRESKPRPVFGKEVFDELGVSAANENRGLQNFAKPQIINSAINPAQERVDFNSQNVNLQHPQTIAQINLTRAEKPIPKPDKPLEMSMKISDLNFKKFLNPVANEAEVIKVTPNSLIEDSAVFEQIEPKIIELAKFVDKTGETDLLKMRLNPAELGEIEIRLEKDASGKINAHIQTKTEATQHILGESLGQLRESLQNAGWQVEKLEVSFDANQSNGNEHRENGSREFETEETGRKNAFGFDGNLENEGEKTENPSDRLVNLRA